MFEENITYTIKLFKTYMKITNMTGNHLKKKSVRTLWIVRNMFTIKKYLVSQICSTGTLVMKVYSWKTNKWQDLHFRSYSIFIVHGNGY